MIVMMMGLSSGCVFQALQIREKQTRGRERLLLAVRDYCVPNVSAKVIRIILSDTDHVNRVVWREY